MSSLTIQDIIRAAHVDRWQIVRTLRNQNIAEHQYMVTMIALEIAERVMGDSFDREEKALLMEWGMRHDLPEVMMGDICTPVKQRIREAVGNLAHDPFDIIEQEICETCHQAKLNAGHKIRSIVKLADLIDGIRFMSLEGHGEHANHVLTKITKIFRKYVVGCKKEWPDENWDEVYLIHNEIMRDECGYLKFEGLDL